MNEHRDNYKNIDFKDKCNIIEKHIGLSIILKEKKSFKELNNDKIRAKMSSLTSKFK